VGYWEKCVEKARITHFYTTANRNKPKLKPVYTSDEKLRVNTGNTDPESASK